MDVVQEGSQLDADDTGQLEIGTFSLLLSHNMGPIYLGSPRPPDPGEPFNQVETPDPADPGC